MLTRSQKRAQEAHKLIRTHMGQPIEAEYLRFSRSFPVLLRSSGLAQALAYCAQKSQKPNEGNIAPTTGFKEDLAKVLGTTFDKLLTESLDCDLRTYMQKSREVLDAASWLKRFSEALLEDKKQ